MKVWTLHLPSFPCLRNMKSFVAKKRGSGILTTHALFCVDPDVHVLQIDLTLTDLPRHLQSSSMPSWSLRSSMIQRLSYTTTQQWHNTDLLSCTSTLMQLEKKGTRVSYSQHIYIPESTSVSSIKFTRTVWKFLRLLPLCLPL
jgi:hypothetical protein